MGGGFSALRNVCIFAKKCEKNIFIKCDNVHVV